MISLDILTIPLAKLWSIVVITSTLVSDAEPSITIFQFVSCFENIDFGFLVIGNPDSMETGFADFLSL